jgi:hypothetical protein
MKHNKGFTSIIIALILVGILIIGGGVFYLSKNSIDKKIKIEEIQSQADQNILGNIIIPSDWVTYSDSNLGFEFKHPSDLHFDLSSFGLRGEIGAITDFNTIDDSVNANISFRSRSGIPAIVDSVVVDGQDARTVCDSNGQCDITIAFPKPALFVGERYFKFLVNSVDIPQKYLGQILSTFKFTK